MKVASSVLKKAIESTKRKGRNIVSQMFGVCPQKWRADWQKGFRKEL